jgi:uncharacterized protein YceK
MKKTSLLVVSASWLLLAGCGGAPEEQAPDEGEVSAQAGTCEIRCDDGRTTASYAENQSVCGSIAYNYCYPYGGSVRYTSNGGGGPGDTW